MKYFHPFLMERVCFNLSGNEAPLKVINHLWQDKYTEAMLELNPEALPARIAIAEKAIAQRIAEIRLSNEGSEEEQWTLGDALRGLRVLAQAECEARRPSEPNTRQRQEAP